MLEYGGIIIFEEIYFYYYYRNNIYVKMEKPVKKRIPVYI